MSPTALLLLPILIPLAAGVLVLLVRWSSGRAQGALALLATIGSLLTAIYLFNKDLSCSLPWGGMGMAFALRADRFSAFILLSAAALSLLVTLYSFKFMIGRRYPGQFYCYLLLSLASLNGAVLADHLVVLLFFWEGLLATTFGMIAIGRPGAFKTATKALIIVGITDLCLLLGIALTGVAAGTLILSKIRLPLDSLASAAMLLMMIGAISKAGAMPFHSWIPDAAVDAPLPFMAFMPGSLEKLLGIYFLARISLDLFQMTPGAWISMVMMIIGAATIVLAVMMALVQKDYKRLLSYHAISQVGYMILGIGTAVPIGIVGGLFHMLNNAMYKSCLFLTAGSVEKQAGTTDLEKLGGLARKMPVTFACFFVAALSISGVPPFNGFFSKEMVYDAARSRHVAFYLAALVGSFFTAASFLKLGHSAFLGRRRAENDGVKEAPPSMLLPMIVIAGSCALFGLVDAIPVRHLIEPAVRNSAFAAQHWTEPHSFAGWHLNAILVILTLISLAAALLNHLLGARIGGGGLHAADHIHYAPVLSGIYARAQKRYFDPYDIGMKFAMAISRGLWGVDRGIDWCYDRLAVAIAGTFSRGIRLAHTGDYATYALWCVAGAAAVIVFLAMAV